MQPPADPSIKDDEQKRRSARWLAGAYSLAWGFPAAIAIGIGLGWWLDKQFHTSPWLMVVFSVFGAIAAFVNLFRLGMRDDGTGK